MKCFHHNDLDGICSAAIVNYACRRMNGVDLGEPSHESIEFISIDYKDDFPFGSILKDEKIFIVDFSLQKEGDFNKLLSITRNIIWIDHHKTAIEKHREFEGVISGTREDGTAGCVLAWKWFFPEVPVPLIVNMLGHYDIWYFAHYGEEKLSQLQCGIRLQDYSPVSKNWTNWFSGDGVQGLIQEGDIALRYRTNYWASIIKSLVFFSNFEGYTAVCCNQGCSSSQLFDSVKEPYDIMMPFSFDGKKWKVSIYTKRDDIDCSKIAKKYGGGGHKKASGFSASELPFTRREETECK